MIKLIVKNFSNDDGILIFKILYKKIMFQSSVYGKKEDKICSISDFQSSQSFSVPAQQSIENKAIDLVKESTHRIRYKPVYIISPNFRAKHITILTLLLQRQGIPIQYQHQTDSLGEEVNTTFFVVVDNKAGPLALGKEFDSELITVVGYPKKGSNKRNLYCKQPQQVYQEYMMFVQKNSNKGYEKELEEKLNKLGTGRKIKEKRGSIFGGDNSNIKLKSISKYDRKEKSNMKQSVKNLQSGVLKGYGWDKQNVESKKRIDTIQTQRKGVRSNQSSNLHILESDSNEIYNRAVQKHYQELKSQEDKDLIKLYKNQEQLIQDLARLIQSNSVIKLTAKRRFHYILVSYQMALKLATRVNSQLYLMKSMVRLIVAIFQNQDKLHHTERQDYQQTQLLVVQKAMKSDLFWCIVCGDHQLSKVMAKTGFSTKSQLNQDNVPLKAVLKSSKKVLIQQKSQHEISEDMISFCPQKQAKSFKTIDKNSSTKIQKSSSIHPVDKKGIDHPNFRLNNFEVRAQSTKIDSSNIAQGETKPRSKIKIIPAINSMLSPGKSSVSSKQSPSKIRFLKVIKKSNLTQNNSQIREDRQRNLAEANSQYCIDKNRGIVSRLQSKIQQSKRSLSSRKSLRSIQNGSQRSIRNGQQKQGSQKSSNKLRDSISVEYGRGSSDIKKENRKLIKEKNNDQYSRENTSKRPLVDQKRQVRKLKMSVDQNKDFVAQCSQLSLLSDYQTSQRKIQNPTLDNNTQKQVKRKVSSNILSANQYYFGSQKTVQKRWQQQQTFAKNHSVIDGLLYIQYNSLISQIMERFRVECPQRVIEEKNMRRFYLAREYSRELRRLWSGDLKRGILPVLVDLQGLGEVVKYYSNVMYDDDEMGFCSMISDNSQFKKSGTAHFYHHGNSAILPQFTDDNRPLLMIFFTIVTEKQQQHQVFAQLDLLSSRLPWHEVIKCVISQQVLRDDKLSRDKSRQIYQQMMDYFLELSEEYGERVVGTV